MKMNTNNSKNDRKDKYGPISRDGEEERRRKKKNACEKKKTKKEEEEPRAMVNEHSQGTSIH